MHIYIESLTLKVKCTPYGICEQKTFKNARTMIFMKSGGAGSSFWSGSENLELVLVGCPCPNPPPLKARRGRFKVPCKSLVTQTTRRRKYDPLFFHYKVGTQDSRLSTFCYCLIQFIHNMFKCSILRPEALEQTIAKFLQEH